MADAMDTTAEPERDDHVSDAASLAGDSATALRACQAEDGDSVPSEPGPGAAREAGGVGPEQAPEGLAEHPAEAGAGPRGAQIGPDMDDGSGAPGIADSSKAGPSAAAPDAEGGAEARGASAGEGGGASAGEGGSASAGEGGGASGGAAAAVQGTGALGEGDEAGEEAAPEVTESEDEAAGRSEEEADRLKGEGNAAFLRGELEEALSLYEEAVAAAPQRRALAGKLAAYHANRAACLLKLGRHEECIAACDDCLDLQPGYLKALLRRVAALEKLEMHDEATQDYEDILADFPGNATAKAGLARLNKAKAAREEELKAEMMGKLKDMGNSLLGHFGMSVDNFKFEKDPKTGGYSVNFQQGAPAPAPDKPGTA